jgi:hypothetical protein
LPFPLTDSRPLLQSEAQLSELSPHAEHRPYRRWIEGSSLSLEANTPSSPIADVYHVLREGVVCFSSDDLEAAREVFDRLAVAHWEDLLTSPHAHLRLDAARGLFGHDPKHSRALAILVADGDDRDRRRLAQSRQRAQYEARRTQFAASRPSQRSD